MSKSAKALRETEKKNAASNKKAPKGAVAYSKEKDKNTSKKAKPKKSKKA